MKPYRYLPLTLGILLAAASAGSARAQNAVPDLTGSWSGFARSDADPANSAPIRLVVTAQRGRSFDGAIRFYSPTPLFPPVPLHGAISASGMLNLVAQGPHGAVFEMHGPVTDFGDGSVRVGGSFHAFPPVPVRGQGAILLLKSYSSFPPEPVAPAGSYQSNRDAAIPFGITIDAQDGSLFTGRTSIRFDEVSVSFAGVIGQYPPDPLVPPNPCHLIALAPAGMVTLDGAYDAASNSFQLLFRSETTSGAVFQAPLALYPPVPVFVP